MSYEKQTFNTVVNTWVFIYKLTLNELVDREYVNKGVAEKRKAEREIITAWRRKFK